MPSPDGEEQPAAVPVGAAAAFVRSPSVGAAGGGAASPVPALAPDGPWLGLARLPPITGGVLRHGIRAGRAITLGVDPTGSAPPLIRAATESETAARGLLITFVDELRVSVSAAGARPCSRSPGMMG
ncbi:MAG: hypothetical protein AVDCRST_MAG19-2941 [uncultured Thermomicrobiales bacterium]|uniref:Uncharacterized protein n=1 Tax=uncultured Thermomicrobiales bacterium TaxID=1645740 RepID=A0A6J4VB79_9BACT|nr:MAG: hypothetical protein AVDCRST_MAG19-2941 [uncultured Thermomicrobiales bacterium]